VFGIDLDGVYRQMEVIIAEKLCSAWI